MEKKKNKDEIHNTKSLKQEMLSIPKPLTQKKPRACE